MKIYQHDTILQICIQYFCIYPIPNIFALCKEVKPQFVHTNATEGRKSPPIVLNSNYLAMY